MAYRWEHTDAALTQQLLLEEEGFPSVVEPGHAAVQFTNPTSGGDVLPTIRAEMHRLRAGSQTAATRETGSSVWQVFTGEGFVRVDGERWEVSQGDLVAVPSWSEWSLEASSDLDLFRFSDAPIFERLHASRVKGGAVR
jgi:gentisate 1,2-dioxygenase